MGFSLKRAFRSISRPIRKAVKKIAKPIKKLKLENAIKYGYNPFGKIADKAFGMKGASLLTNSTAHLAGELAEKKYDKPKEFAALEKQLNAEQAAEQLKFDTQMANRARNSAASAKGAKDLLASRRRQGSRGGKKSRGRRSTILTDSLGGSGQSLKSLLGM